MKKLNAPSISFPRIDGLSAAFLYLDCPVVHRGIGVSSDMRLSMADPWANDPNWDADIAPVSLSILAMRCTKIFSNVFPRQESREIGNRFLGSGVSVRSGLGIDTHFASFQAVG